MPRCEALTRQFRFPRVQLRDGGQVLGAGVDRQVPTATFITIFRSVLGAIDPVPQSLRPEFVPMGESLRPR